MERLSWHLSILKVCLLAMTNQTYLLSIAKLLMACYTPITLHKWSHHIRLKNSCNCLQVLWELSIAIAFWPPPLLNVQPPFA